MHHQVTAALVAIDMPEGYTHLASGESLLIYRSVGDTSPSYAIAARSAARAARIPEYKVEMPLVSGPAWASRTVTAAEADRLKAALTEAGEPYETEPLSG